MTVTAYNFRKPGRMHSGLEQQFQVWLETACAVSTQRWKKDLPAALEISLAGSDAQRARPSLLALSEDMVGYRVTLHDKLITLLAWPRPLVLGIIGILMGDTVAELPPSRDLTAVDESLFLFFLRDFLLPSFVENWGGQPSLRPEIGEQIPHPRWAKLFPPEDTLLVVQFLMKGAFGESSWSLLFHRTELSSSWHDEGAATGEPANVQTRLISHVNALPVEVSVELGAARLPLAELAHLRPGDVILLDQAVNQPLQVKIEGTDKLRAWPGRQGNRQALRIDLWK